MKNNKMVYVAVAAVIFSVILTVVVLFMNVGKSNGKMSKGMNEVVNNYISYVNSGEYVKAYESLSAQTVGYVTVESFAQLMGAVMNEKDARLTVDENKKIEEREIGEDKNKIAYTAVPINRIYIKGIGDEKKSIIEDITINIIEDKSGYKIYMSEFDYNEGIARYVIKKARECAIEALENKNTEKIVSQKAEEIDSYIQFANTVSATYEGYNEVMLQIDLISAYKLLAQGEEDRALDQVNFAHSKAETEEQKITVCRVESEMYFAGGHYSQSVEVLKKALEVSPNNEDLRRDYRRINSMMLDQIETSLARGWSQVSSAIKQDKKEMERILSDIALVEAEKAIRIKNDAPDGYYLKGNIEYCLGRYSDSVSTLEKAVELSRTEDNEFKTKAAEVLGMARVANASNNTEDGVDISSYERVFDKEVRSLLFRESEISGIVDAIE